MQLYLLPQSQSGRRRRSASGRPGLVGCAGASSLPPADGLFPAGYVDLGETLAEAAIRETQEETLLNIRLDGLLNVYSYANVGIVLVVYRATVVSGVAGTTPESQEVRAFRLEDIPWADLAFPSTRDALTDYVRSDKKSK